MEKATFNVDEKAWRCIPKGSLRSLIVEIPPDVKLEPDVLKEIVLENARARAVLEAIPRNELVSLRELRNVYGEFDAIHQPTSTRVTSRGIQDAEVHIA